MKQNYNKEKVEMIKIDNFYFVVYNKEKVEMIKIDNFYFVVENIEKSVEFYTTLLNQKPANIIKDRRA